MNKKKPEVFTDKYGIQTLKTEISDKDRAILARLEQMLKDREQNKKD